jgi:hypothetical protein
MNKTSKRATQKHRANAKRYALRRKAEAGQATTTAKPKGPAGTASAARARSAPKPVEEPAEAETTS